MSQNNGNSKRSEKGLLTPDNCVVAFIDHQPQMLFGTSNFDRQSIINSTVALAKATRIFDVPVVLTTVETKSFSGNIWPQLKAVFPGQEPIERSSMDSWDDKNFVAAIEKTGRKKIVLAGLWTETCIALPTIQAIRWLRNLCGRGLLRRRQPVGARQCHAPGCTGRCQAGDCSVHASGMAARLGESRHVRRSHGSGEEPLRGLRYRRGIRLHDGPRRAA